MKEEIAGRFSPTSLMSDFHLHSPAWTEDRQPVGRIYPTRILNAILAAGIDTIYRPRRTYPFLWMQAFLRGLCATCITRRHPARAFFCPTCGRRPDLVRVIRPIYRVPVLYRGELGGSEGADDPVITAWLTQDGAVVKAGEAVCRIEVDLLMVEIICPAAGLLRHARRVGDRVHTGDVLAWVYPATSLWPGALGEL